MPKCRNCGEKFQVKVFLQKYCRGSDSCLEAETSYALAQVSKQNQQALKKAEQKAKQQDKEWQQRKKKLKRELETVSQARKRVQDNLNKLVHWLDSGLPCVSCDNPKPSEAGHYFTVGAHSEIALHLHNIHMQCHQCNNHNGGNEREYYLRIGQRYGADYQEYLHYRIRREYQHLRLSKEDFWEAGKIVNRLLREVKKISPPDTLAKRLEWRDKLNSEIGIYLTQYL